MGSYKNRKHHIRTCVPTAGITGRDRQLHTTDLPTGVGTSNYIPHILGDVITCPCPWCMMLVHCSSYPTSGTQFLISHRILLAPGMAFSILRSEQNGWHHKDDIFKCIFLDENRRIFFQNVVVLSPRVQLIIIEHWSRLLLGTEQATSNYLRGELWSRYMPFMAPVRVNKLLQQVCLFELYRLLTLRSELSFIF